MFNDSAYFCDVKLNTNFGKQKVKSYLHFRVLTNKPDD